MCGVVNNQSQGIMAGWCWTSFFTQFPSFCRKTLFWTISSAWDTAPSGTPFSYFCSRIISIIVNLIIGLEVQFSVEGSAFEIIFMDFGKLGWKEICILPEFNADQLSDELQHCCLHSSSGCNIFLLYWNFKKDSKDSSPMSLAHSFIHTESQFTNNTMFILTFSVTLLGPRGPHLIS